MSDEVELLVSCCCLLGEMGKGAGMSVQCKHNCEANPVVLQVCLHCANLSAATATYLSKLPMAAMGGVSFQWYNARVP